MAVENGTALDFEGDSDLCEWQAIALAQKQTQDLLPYWISQSNHYPRIHLLCQSFTHWSFLLEDARRVHVQCFADSIGNFADLPLRVWSRPQSDDVTPLAEVGGHHEPCGHSLW